MDICGVVSPVTPQDKCALKFPWGIPFHLYVVWAGELQAEHVSQ